MADSKPHFGSTHARLVALAKASGTTAEIVGDRKQEERTSPFDIDSAIDAFSAAVEKGQQEGRSLGLGTAAARAARAAQDEKPNNESDDRKAALRAQFEAMSDEERSELQTLFYETAAIEDEWPELEQDDAEEEDLFADAAEPYLDALFASVGQEADTEDEPDANG